MPTPRKDPKAKSVQRRSYAPLKPEPLPEYPPYFQGFQLEGFMTNQTYIGAEGWAKQILGRAGLPPDINLIEAQGFREGEDIEWYAAAILRYSTLLQYQFSGGIPRDDWEHSFKRDPIVLDGRVQDMKSLKAKLDRLIRKAEIIANPDSRKVRPGGKARGKQETDTQKPIWDEMQTEANKLWKKHRRWNKSDVIRILQKKYPYSLRTLYRRIKKTSS